MDYTLSQYRPETFEVLAYNLTIEKLVNNFNYPKVRRNFTLTCPSHETLLAASVTSRFGGMSFLAHMP